MKITWQHVDFLSSRIVSRRCRCQIVCPNRSPPLCKSPILQSRKEAFSTSESVIHACIFIIGRLLFLAPCFIFIAPAKWETSYGNRRLVDILDPEIGLRKQNGQHFRCAGFGLAGRRSHFLPVLGPVIVPVEDISARKHPPWNWENDRSRAEIGYWPDSHQFLNRYHSWSWLVSRINSTGWSATWLMKRLLFWNKEMMYRVSRSLLDITLRSACTISSTPSSYFPLSLAP